MEYNTSPISDRDIEKSKDIDHKGTGALQAFEVILARVMGILRQQAYNEAPRLIHEAREKFISRSEPGFPYVTYGFGSRIAEDMIATSGHIDVSTPLMLLGEDLQASYPGWKFEFNVFDGQLDESALFQSSVTLFVSPDL